MFSAAGDGFYQLSENSLWYRPQREPWRAVIKNVKINKTFGGRAPFLPVRYLGEDRFAVARTIDKGPEEQHADGKQFPQAYAVTMLLNGRTGEVLKESDPYLYDHNPPLRIPAAWHKKDAVVDKHTGKECLFKWGARQRMITFGAGKPYPLGESERAAVSCDGRFMFLYKEFFESAKRGTKMQFHLLDGTSGTDRLLELESASEEFDDSAWSCCRKPCKMGKDFFWDGFITPPLQIKTAYFRGSFEVPDPGRAGELTLHRIAVHAGAIRRPGVHVPIVVAGRFAHLIRLERCLTPCGMPTIPTRGRRDMTHNCPPFRFHVNTCHRNASLSLKLWREQPGEGGNYGWLWAGQWRSVTSPLAAG